MNFPKLFSKNADGSVNEWSITVRDNVIVTTYGRTGGAMMATEDVVLEGKNIGKKNETTAAQQAQKEAKSRWTKKKKSGYVETIADAKADKVDAVIAGGIEPMLAQKFRDHSAKIVWPAYVQPKLDGIRCIAIVKNGKCTLWSRTRKAITSVPHIVAHIERAFVGKDIVLDGELYNHSMKAEFEKIVSFVRQQKPMAGHEVVQYHIYDAIMPGSFEARSSFLDSNIPSKNPALKLVQTVKVANEDEMMDYFLDFRDAGYEGCMVRNAASVYEQKRSYNLQKVKEMDDAEFDIVGVEEGRGKMAGKAIFICKTAQGNEFRAKMEGNIDALAKYLHNAKLWKGKKLTVRYQGFTNGDKPRFPVGVTVRDYE